MLNINRKYFYYFFILLVLGIFFVSFSVVLHAQGKGRKPIDMMLVIDNSGSMFPKSKNYPNYAGNDADFLRITGANLFIARLGFGEPQATEYQVGVVNLGYPSRLMSPLQPVSTQARDALATIIAKPKPENYTEMVPALKIAYEQLNSSNHRAGNLPAIILITDGRPTPAEGQTDDEIAKLVQQYPDIPIFVMLLQNPDKSSPEFERYIEFWQQMQANNSNIYSYRIFDDSEIENTYNKIIAQLQNTIPPEIGIDLPPNTPYQVFVNKYVKRIIVTVIHDKEQPKGKIIIQDPAGKSIQLNEPGVEHFRGTENPVEVFSITMPRLAEELKDDFWSITSDAPVRVFLDRVGSYQIKVLSPDVVSSDTNVYVATNVHSFDNPLDIRFVLQDENNVPITEPQKIDVKYFLPSGQEGTVSVPDPIRPDEQGVYNVPFRFDESWLVEVQRPQYFTFVINAGVADDTEADDIPIARTTLKVNVGKTLQTEDVQPIFCNTGQPTEISIKLDNTDTILLNTLQAYVSVDGQEQQKLMADSNLISGDITGLCQALLAEQKCSESKEYPLTLKIMAQRVDNLPMSPIQHTIPMQIQSPECTPTPSPVPPATPTLAPTPAPTATPIPDTDRDSFNDLVDRCPNEPVWLGIRFFAGCPPPWWFLVVVGILLLLALAALVLYGIPWATVKISPPPDGYYLICDPEKGGMGQVKRIRTLGENKRTNKITIGGSKRDTLYVEGLKPKQYQVIRQKSDKKGDKSILITGGRTKELKEYPETISAGRVRILLGTDSRKLRC